MSVSTPHIEVSRKNDFAKTVIMPGDPKRAIWIAKKFLTEVKLINDIRGNLAYTGFYKGKRVSVMSSGMGCPSMGIYSYELFNFCNVENIIRIGTCGTYDKNLHLGDLIASQKTLTNTNYCGMLEKGITTLKASQDLLGKAKKLAKENNIKVNFGTIFCTDTFYSDKSEKKFMLENNCLCVEMESAALYYNAKKLKKHALTICSISDNITTNEKLTALERAKTLKNMVLFALDLVLRC